MIKKYLILCLITTAQLATCAQPANDELEFRYAKYLRAKYRQEATTNAETKNSLLDKSLDEIRQTLIECDREKNELGLAEELFLSEQLSNQDAHVLLSELADKYQKLDLKYKHAIQAMRYKAEQNENAAIRAIRKRDLIAGGIIGAGIYFTVISPLLSKKN